MAELVIKISEEDWKFIKEADGCRLSRAIIDGIINGTPLPKGHGRIGDLDIILNKAMKHRESYMEAENSSYCRGKLHAYELYVEEVENAPTIIEADKDYEAKVITRGNCMICGKELTEGLFFCKKCENNIKALNQEPILDKIRAEIEQNAYPIVHGVNNREKGMTLYGILQIIDKYKAESEE